MQTLNVNNLTFEYQPDSVIFQDVNIQFPLHKFSLLIGPSGSGKSTLLKIIAGLYPQFGGRLTGGQLSMDGIDFTDWNSHKVAMLFQNPNQQFTMDTPKNELIFVLENLQVPPSEMDDQISAALNFVDCADLADRNFNTLSGGEKQKVALAVIVAMDNDVILLDEPFASVDPGARAHLLGKLTELRDKYHKTIILAEHDLHGYQSIADEVFQITANNGQIVPLEQTARQQLFNQFENATDATKIKLPNGADQPVISLSNLQIDRQNKTLLKQKSFAFFS